MSTETFLARQARRGAVEIFLGRPLSPLIVFRKLEKVEAWGGLG